VSRPRACPLRDLSLQSPGALAAGPAVQRVPLTAPRPCTLCALCARGMERRHARCAAVR